MAAGGSPLTVARPCRIPTSFPGSRAVGSSWRRDEDPLDAAPQATRVPPFARFRVRAVSLVAPLAALALLAGVPARADAPARRIVSLIPSITEDLFALGVGDRVVGVSSFTFHPAAAARRPVVASPTSVDVERVVALHPDLVVGVSAQTNLAVETRKAGLRTVLMSDDTYGDIFRDITALGALTGRVAFARTLNERLRARERAIIAGVPANVRRPRVFVVLDVTPIYTVGRGSFIDELLRRAGAANAAGDVGQPYPRLSDEAVLARQPDALIVPQRIAQGGMLQRQPWRDLRAVRAGHVWVLPDDGVLDVPGPRYVDGIAWVAAHVRSLR